MILVTSNCPIGKNEKDDKAKLNSNNFNVLVSIWMHMKGDTNL